MTNKEVARGFIRKLPLSSSNLYSTEDGKLFSYNTCIAQHLYDEIIGNSTKYSVTTSKHLGYIKNYITIWTPSNVRIPIGTRDLTPYLNTL